MQLFCIICSKDLDGLKEATKSAMDSFLTSGRPVRERHQTLRSNVQERKQLLILSIGCIETSSDGVTGVRLCSLMNNNRSFQRRKQNTTVLQNISAQYICNNINIVSDGSITIARNRFTYLWLLATYRLQTTNYDYY